MTSNGFEKFYGYPKNTWWIKVYLFLYTYLGVFGFAAYCLNKLTDSTMVSGVQLFFDTGILTYPVCFFAISALLWISYVLSAIFLPLIDKKSFRFVIVNLICLALYRPLILLGLVHFNQMKTISLVTFLIVYGIELAFIGFNLVYFSERKDLFYSSINKIIMDEEKDPLKH